MSEKLLSIDSGDGLVFLELESGKFTLTPYVIKCQWTNGRAMVVDGATMRAGYIDEAGREIVPCVYGPGSTEYCAQRAAVSDPVTEKYGAIDEQGNVVIPFEYDSLSQFDKSGHAIGSKTIDGIRRYCRVDAMGNVTDIFPGEGERTYIPVSSLVWSSYNAQPQLMSSDGKVLWAEPSTMSIYVAENATALIQTYYYDEQATFCERCFLYYANT